MRGKSSVTEVVRHRKRRNPADELTSLPSVGESIAEDLRQLGYERPRDLVGEDPEQMYERWMVQRGVREPCMLYTFRCAVYCAETPEGERDPELTQWWRWKNVEEVRDV